MSSNQAKLFRVRDEITGEITSSIIFKHPCKDCGYPHAAFGRGVSYLGFLRSHAKGKPDYKLLGEWTCGINGCVNKGKQ